VEKSLAQKYGKIFQYLDYVSPCIYLCMLYFKMLSNGQPLRSGGASCGVNDLGIMLLGPPKLETANVIHGPPGL